MCILFPTEKLDFRMRLDVWLLHATDGSARHEPPSEFPLRLPVAGIVLRRMLLRKLVPSD